MRELFNLIVDLSELCEGAEPSSGIAIDGPAAAGERSLAWIDATFGGWWSSEANAGANLVARRGEELRGFATIDPRGLQFSWLQGLARERDVGVFGPFGVAPEERGVGLGRALLERSLRELQTRGYSRALICAVGDERLIRYYGERAGATVAERYDVGALTRPRRRTVVLASGNGTNLQSVLDAVA
ncbi:MAG: GNAT family N-acetyltransferase, partial [Candidatus Eremiobacteraeota bacterium]|nr:GNAT family N-acetyltransferase [Candidatus Eremiobacteraeota bacterium]